MSKIFTSILVMSGISLLFYLGGVLEGTVTTSLLDAVLNPERFQSASFWIKTLAVSTLSISAVGLVASRLTNLQTDFFLMFPIAAVLFTFGFDFIRIFQAMATTPVTRVIASLLYGPFLLAYAIGVVEWWRGVDT